MISMFKKFNWGHGITLFYIFFVGIVVTALVASFGVDHSLVVDEYYSEDLAYQSKYDKMANSLNSDNINIITAGEDVVISFPGVEKVSGEVHFYRASDKSQDFTRNITSNQEIFSKTTLSKGKWSVKVDWETGGKSYYKEEVIYL